MSTIFIKFPVFSRLLLLLAIASSASGERWGAISATDYGAGDVMKTKDGRLLAAISSNQFVTATVNGKNILISTMSDKGLRDQVALVAVPLEPGWNSAKRIALANKLSGKLYPYGMVSCNAKDYMNYIVSGKTTKPLADSTCPLRRGLAAVTVQEINSDAFYLESKTGRVVVNQLPKA